MDFMPMTPNGTGCRRSSANKAPSKFPLPAITPAMIASHMRCSWNMAIRSASTAKKAGIAFHWRIQPVIIVAPDGRSARLRTYLFHPNTSKTGSSTLFGAMYPDDHLILEDGIWRLWNLSLDEPYFEMPNWKSGWALLKERTGCGSSTATGHTCCGDSTPCTESCAPPTAFLSARPWSHSTGRMCQLMNSAYCRNIFAAAPASPGRGPRFCQCGGTIKTP